jgi:hypothetical protein
MKKLICFFPAAILAAAAGAAVVKRQSVINAGTTIAARGSAEGLYSKECHDTYTSCMDQFCTLENDSGGRCQCSDDYKVFADQMAAFDKQDLQAETLRTIEIEKIQAGSRADIVFSAERRYDEKGNVITVQQQDKAAARKRPKLDLSMWNKSAGGDDWENGEDALKDLAGAALYSGARNICIGRVPDSCESDIGFITQLYATQIKADCKAFENSVAARKKASDENLAAAQAEVRGARLESFNEANKYDRGQCMVQFRDCMSGEDACGAGWSKCVSSIAQENMQNKKARSAAGSTVAHVAKYSITDVTLEALDAKRNICEHVLDQCMAVRDMVWPDFLRDIAPDLKTAELNAESNFRQSCLSGISDCIHQACRDHIDGDSIDACLAYPDSVRSYCKAKLEPCERMEPRIWSFVKDKLAAMRVDRCTEEVRSCFAGICGEDFSQCIGMDYKFMHDICPVDKLVVCKQGNPNFNMSDIDGMLMGFYLNVDNSMLDNCQNIMQTKMLEVCGSATDCNRFAADDTLGTNSLRSQKIGDLYRVTGMISFGAIKVGDGTDRDGGKKLGAGEVGVADYVEEMRKGNSSVPNKEAIVSTIETELNNIAGTINRTIELISADPKIQFCITGRDLSQINGRGSGKNNMTTARFPNLMHQVKMAVAESALRRANDNYNKKLAEEIAKATKDASADLAQFMCQKMAETGGVYSGAGTVSSSSLTPPYAISYDIALGVAKEDMMKNARDMQKSGGMSVNNGKFTSSGGGTTRETWAAFDREGRNCRFCSSTVTENCKSTGSRGLFGLWDSRGVSCESSDPVEKCQDIPM